MNDTIPWNNLNVLRLIAYIPWDFEVHYNTLKGIIVFLVGTDKRTRYGIRSVIGIVLTEVHSKAAEWTKILRLYGRGKISSWKGVNSPTHSFGICQIDSELTCCNYETPQWRNALQIQQTLIIDDLKHAKTECCPLHSRFLKFSHKYTVCVELQHLLDSYWWWQLFSRESMFNGFNLNMVCRKI